MLKKLFKLFLFLFIIFFLVVTTVLTVVQIPSVQSKIIHDYVMPEVNQMFGTKMDVQEVDITFFGDISLKNISALDERDSLLISIKELQASPDYFKLINGSPYQLDEISLYEPKVYVKTYEGADQDNFLNFIDRFDSGSETKDSTKLVLEGDINIYDGYLEIVNENLPKEEQTWVKASDLNLEIDNFKLDDADIYATIKNLSFKAKRNEKIQSELKHLAGNFTYRSDLLEIQDISLETDNSKLNGQFAFVYNRAEDFNDFYNKINWKVDLEKGSYVGMKDVQYFVPYWDKFSKVDIQGKIRGTLSHLELHNVEVSTMKTKIRGEKIILNEIYDAQKFHIKGQNTYVTSNYNNLIKFLPKDINRDIPSLINDYGQVTLKGNLEIDRQDFATKSSIQSSTLGSLMADIAIKGYSEKSIHYKGNIRPQKFNLKKLTGVKELGFITGNLDIDGKGYDLNTMKIKVKGNVAGVDLMNKHLSNIRIDGSVVEQLFSGVIDIDDPNIALSFDGDVDFSSSVYDANFKSTVRNVNLYKLGLSKDPVAKLTTDISIDLHASSLDDLLGQVLLENTFYQTSTQSLAFNRMLINSSIDENGKRLINFQSEEIINGYMEGDFKLSEMLVVSENAFGKLLTNYKPKPMTLGQYFNFDIDIKDYFFEILFPAIVLKPGTKLEGKVTSENHLILKTKTPGLIYDKYELGKSQVTLNTKNPFFQTSLVSDKVNLGGYELENVKILTINNNDTLEMKAKFTGHIGGISKQEFGLNLYKTKNDQGKNLIGFLKSTIKYNDNEWVLNPNNEEHTHYALVDFKNNEYYINRIVIESGIQKLEVNGSYLKDYLNLDLEVQNVELESLLPPFEESKLEGLANGKITIEYGKDTFQPIADLKIQNFTYNDYSFGDILANIEIENGLYKVDSKIQKDNLDRLAVTGYIDPNNKDDYLRLKVDFEWFELAVLNIFMVDVAENIRGTIKGEIDLTGTLKRPEYQGSINLSEGGMKISYLGTDYDILGTPEILISTGLIYFYDRIELRDIKNHTRGSLTGDLSHEDFLVWHLNLDLFADNFLVMDTGFKNNPLFYGKVFANDLYATIKGPATDLDINVIATTAPRTALTINTSGQSLEVSDVVTFVNVLDRYKEFEEGTKEMVEPAGMNLGLNIKITPDAELDLILDEKNDDKIVASGKGNLLLDVDLNGNMAMNGEIGITDGYYNFARGAIKKIFRIRPNSTIKWIGDVYDAQLDVKAYFERNVSNVGEYISSSYAQNLQTEVEIALTGPLSSPEIEFNVLTPDASESIQSNLNLKFSDKDEEVRQWGGILLFGKFLPPDNSNYISGLTTTAYELAFGQLSSLLSNISRYVTLNLGYTEGSDEYNTSDVVNVKGSVDVNPRISVNVSGGFAVSGNRSASEGVTNTQSITGSAEVEYDISKQNDGTLKLKAFSRPTSFGVENFNAANTYSQAWGGGIYYHEDFNTFKELRQKLFKSDKRQKEEKENTRKDSLNQILNTEKGLFKEVQDTVKIE
ncbi:MAG: translocation/assembly module TamB domain-containing protein [Flavobacteriales bacterium]